MRHRPCVFGELYRLQERYILNPLNRARPHVGGKFGIAINRKTLFKA